MRLPAHQVALAVGEPYEARLLGLLEDPAFQVAGRGCAVTMFCTSVRQVREALGRTEAVDVILVSSTLQAMPHATLRELVQAGRPMVVLAPDPSSADSADLAVPVLALDADAAALAAALGDALLGRRSARAQASGRREQAPNGRAPAQKTPEAPRGEVITVSSAGAPDGRTAAVAVPLAYALSFAAPTVLLDVNPRGSGVEFHLDGVDPARGLPQLGRRTYPTDEAWRAALESELQPMGPTGQGWVGCGISTVGYRQYLTATLLERAIATLRSSRRFIVLDSSGSGWAPEDDPLDRTALEQADRLLLVLRPDEEGIARTRRVLGDRANRYRDRVHLVLNQVGLPGTSESVEHIEFLLRVPVAAVLPFDARHVAAARARHRPVVCEPGCRLSGPLLGLAARLAGGGPIRVPVDSPTIPPSTPWRRLAVGAAALLR